MPLVKFAVRRISEEYRLYGHFVIGTSLSRQDEILALLSDRDMRRIGVELRVIHGLDYPMPSNMHYGLSGFALNLIELTRTNLHEREDTRFGFSHYRKMTFKADNVVPVTEFLTYRADVAGGMVGEMGFSLDDFRRHNESLAQWVVRTKKRRSQESSA
jgi:hypothetical protein